MRFLEPYEFVRFRVDFLSEIAFMKTLGFHEHLVNLVGCVSDPKKPLLVVELCELGDLRKLLHRTERRLLKETSAVANEKVRKKPKFAE